MLSAFLKSFISRNTITILGGGERGKGGQTGVLNAVWKSKDGKLHMLSIIWKQTV